MSMCLTLPWSLVFFDKAIAPRLSHLISPGVTYSISTSPNQLCIHTICCAHLDIATYSASTVDKATVACLLLLQVTAPPAIMKTYPEVDLRVSLHPPLMCLSQAEQPTIIIK